MSEKRRVDRPAPEITRGSFPMLATFLGGCLREGWQIDYETPAEARDAFLVDVSPAERREYALECTAFHERTAHLALADVQSLISGVFGSGWAPADEQEIRAVLRVP
jgi:hypothetical protein